LNDEPHEILLRFCRATILAPYHASEKAAQEYDFRGKDAALRACGRISEASRSTKLPITWAENSPEDCDETKGIDETGHERKCDGRRSDFWSVSPTLRLAAWRILNLLAVRKPQRVRGNALREDPF
jgi:hypothetical protein